MKTREEVARFVEKQFSQWPNVYKCPFEKGAQHHYGKQDVRALLDFIYGGEPTTDAERVLGLRLRNR